MNDTNTAREGKEDAMRQFPGTRALSHNTRLVVATRGRQIMREHTTLTMLQAYELAWRKLGCPT